MVYNTRNHRVWQLCASSRILRDSIDKVSPFPYLKMETASFRNIAFSNSLEFWTMDEVLKDPVIVRVSAFWQPVAVLLDHTSLNWQCPDMWYYARDNLTKLPVSIPLHHIPQMKSTVYVTTFYWCLFYIVHFLTIRIMLNLKKK